MEIMNSSSETSRTHLQCSKTLKTNFECNLTPKTHLKWGQTPKTHLEDQTEWEELPADLRKNLVLKNDLAAAQCYSLDLFSDSVYSNNQNHTST